MKKITKLFGLAVVLSFGLQSCSSSDEDEIVNLGEAKTVVNMLSEAQPMQLTEAQRVFVNDNNQFTLNFLKTVNDIDKSGKSFIYSPLSITYVLGMVNDAAVGETEKELEQTLGFHEGGIKAVNDYCKKLIDGLPKVDDKVTLNIANAIFVNKDYTLKPQFEQDTQTYYDAKAESLDFSSPQTLGHINGWCNEKTNGMIPTILDEVDPVMMSYLLNAIYFKADWASKFDQKNTKEETFSTDKGKTKLPLMHQNVLIRYLKNDIYAAVEMPYGNGYWNMTIILPEEGKTTDDIINYMADLGMAQYYPMDNKWFDVFLPMNEARPYEVDIKLPRFETSSDTDELDINDGLAGLMQKMGIKLAFNSYLAEIPNMCEAPVYIAMMRQKAKIKVNEEGSEAAAITVAGMMEKSAISQPIEYPKASFHANRPFVYVIREASSGVILFVGKFTGV
ncbi:MAG: serpin family protein [Prevotella sp.]|nr:serpin family protein [Prevotella sp.]